MQKPKSLKNKIILTALIMSVLGILYATKSFAWQSVTEGISFDPVTNDIIFTTIDREDHSGIYYRTQGFTIADATKDANGNLVETGLGEFNIPLLGYEPTESYLPNDNRFIVTEWRIPYSSVLEHIAATSPEWYNRIQNPTDAVYLKMDAIIAIHNKDKYPPDGWSGAYDEFGMMGLLWDKYNMDELYDAEPWANPEMFDNHYDKFLMIALGAGLIPELPVVQQPTERFDIGKPEPEYYTYNYSTTGQFDLGSGIPTSEQVTNGYEADEWYGYASVGITGANKDYGFSGNITYDVTKHLTVMQYNPDTMTDEEVIVPITYQLTESYSHTVNRAVQFWNILNARFWDLLKVKTENQIDPEGMPYGYINYTSNVQTNFDVTVNGTNLTSVSTISYAPDIDHHVDWPIVSDRKINAYASSKAAAIEAFISIAESRVKPSADIMVRNDNIEINGKKYMSSDYYRYAEFKGTKGFWNSYNDIGDKDYGLEKDESTITIPSTTPNGEYPTTITATYRQACTNNMTVVEKVKSPNNSSISERILSQYTGNEPVIVHTPTISPVEIINPETGEKLTDENSPEDMKSQLLPSAKNEYADYQLLLDGTYTVKFVPEEHFEHIGYPEMAGDLYNKYCKFKQACFPFTIQLDGKIYTPDDSETDAEGNPKVSGYTQWIDLPDFSINDFYIPSWSIEGDSYVVQFRVAPENVVDFYGVNHIDDTEWLKNQTLNGQPLYNYVSYYTFTAQVSGLIYDFQAVGINDRDVYEGFKNDQVSNGIGVQDFPFCPTKQEKKNGTLNRLGGESVRYTVDGKVTNNWDERNTLPFSSGRSQVYEDDGTLRKNNTFAFTIRTIANLYDETDDFIKIKPTFRWVSEDGTEVKEHEDLKIYYKKYGDDQIYDFTEYGSTHDTKETNETSIAEVKFDGSYYAEDLSIDRTLYQDDAEFSKDHANEGLFNLNKQEIPTWPREVYPNANAYLRKTTESYSLSEIILDNNLRLLTGNLEQLERNLDKEQPNLEYIKDETEAGNSYNINEHTNPDVWYKHRESMQTWFGEYWVPDQLYIVDKDVDIYDYLDENGYIDGTEDFWIKDGYLVLNFDIITVNNGKDHLSYYGGNRDQWTLQGPPEEVQTGDEAVDKDIVIPVRPGDVAIIDITTSTKDRYEIGYNYISG